MLEFIPMSEMSTKPTNPVAGDDFPEEGNKPRVSEDLAVSLLERLYGLQVTSVQQMSSYYDNNFRVKVSSEYNNPHLESLCPDGYTVKVFNTAESNSEGIVDGILQAMVHVHKKGVCVPLPIPNKSGQLWSLESVPVKESDRNTFNKEQEDVIIGQCAILVLTYLPGKTLYNVTYTPEVLYKWGQLAAKIQLALETFDSPHLKARYTRWNQLNALTAYPALPAVQDEKNRRLAKSILDAFKEIHPKLKDMPRVFIHGDISENNIVLLDRPPKDCKGLDYGMLDFGCMNYAPAICEVGIAMSYTMIECRSMDPVLAIGHALAGYLSLKEMSKEEMSLLKVCAATRLCQSLVMGAFYYSCDPSNKYILCTSYRGWQVLEQLWTTSKDDLYEKWQKIIIYHNKTVPSCLVCNSH